MPTNLYSPSFIYCTGRGTLDWTGNGPVFDQIFLLEQVRQSRWRIMFTGAYLLRVPTTHDWGQATLQQATLQHKLIITASPYLYICCPDIQAAMLCDQRLLAMCTSTQFPRFSWGVCFEETESVLSVRHPSYCNQMNCPNFCSQSALPKTYTEIWLPKQIEVSAIKCTKHTTARDNSNDTEFSPDANKQQRDQQEIQQQPVQRNTAGSRQHAATQRSARNATTPEPKGNLW